MTPLRDRAAGRQRRHGHGLSRDCYGGDLIALKLPHGEAGEPEEAARFTREAQLLAELRHPGIIAYIAHGQTPHGQRFLAMEWR